MIHISGPKTVGAIKLNNGKHVILFGDEHESRLGLCKPCQKAKGCYYITEFLDRLTKKPTELFLESFWITPEEASNTRLPKYQDDVLGDVNKHFHKKMYQHSKKTGKQTQGPIRVHYADIRTEPSLEELYRIAIGLIMKITNSKLRVQYDFSLLFKHFRTTKHFKKLLDSLVTSNDFKKSINKLLKNDKSLVSRFISSKYSDKPIHKIRKQLKKIKDKQMQSSLLRYYKYRCGDIVKNTKEYDSVIKRATDKDAQQLTEDEEIVIANTLMAWFTHIADMYTLARMLYYMEKGDASVFVSYAGALHTLHYMMFFMAFIKGSTMIHYHPESKTNKNKRCVSLPKEFVASILS